jgi:NAD(P)-dependent dehydrogenase (short-subunit alcohol dehydrogenase family)
MTTSDLAGRHALVTGASQGIGAAIATALAAHGAAVTLLGRRADTLRALAATLPQGSAVCTVVADVSDPVAVASAFETARARLGPIHILVNNAGQAFSAPFIKTPLDDWQRMLAVNLTGTFLCTQAALVDMIAAGWGRIVNVASTASLRGYAYAAAYAASKHGVLGLTRSIALEVAHKGITINAVCPGYTETEILRAGLESTMKRTGRSESDLRAQLAKSNPEGRILDPREVAETVRRLCGEGAAAINGQAITTFDAPPAPRPSASGGTHP